MNPFPEGDHEHWRWLEDKIEHELAQQAETEPPAGSDTDG